MVFRKIIFEERTLSVANDRSAALRIRAVGRKGTASLPQKACLTTLSTFDGLFEYHHKRDKYCLLIFLKESNVFGSTSHMHSGPTFTWVNRPKGQIEPIYSKKGG